MFKYKILSERERERQRETARDRDRQADRQTDRQRQRDRDRDFIPYMCLNLKLAFLTVTYDCVKVNELAFSGDVIEGVCNY